MNQFWRDKSFEQMSREEWESLCDGCAKCCLIKLRDPKTKQVQFTNVVCRFLDQKTCHCSDYPNRHENVPECIFLTQSLPGIWTGYPKPARIVWLQTGKTCPGGTRSRPETPIQPAEQAEQYMARWSVRQRLMTRIWKIWSSIGLSK